MQESAPLIIILRNLKNSTDGLVLRKLAEDALSKKKARRGIGEDRDE